jgi:hypothetical protein
MSRHVSPHAIAWSALVLGVLTLTACTGTSAPTPTHAPSTGSVLYTPPTSAPAPGALYARAVQLASGDLLATFEQYTSGKPVFPIYRSTDDGKTWARFSEVSDTRNGWGLRYQPFLYQLPAVLGDLPKGTILVAGNSIPNDLSKTQLDLYASRDQGKTWKFVSDIADGGKAIPNNGETPVWEPFLLETGGAEDARLIAYYSDQRKGVTNSSGLLTGHGQLLDHETTTDGIHWSEPVDDVVAADPTARPGMPTVAHLGDGQWAMTYEYGGAPEGDFAVYIKFASDPEKFGAAVGHVITTQSGLIGHSSPYVVWADTGGKGELIVSSGESPLLFVNKDYGASDAWSAIPSKVPQGYSRSFVVLAGGRGLFGISGGAIGAQSNTVRYATDALPAS